MLVRQHILSAVPAALQGTYSSMLLPPMLDVFTAVALGKKHWDCAETNCRMQNAEMNNWCILNHEEKAAEICFVKKQQECDMGGSFAEHARKSGT